MRIDLLDLPCMKRVSPQDILAHGDSAPIIFSPCYKEPVVRRWRVNNGSYTDTCHMGSMLRFGDT
jgi:hypothetical protein